MRGAELIPAMPRKTVVQGCANDRMPERVAFIPFLEDVHLQSAIQRVEEHRD